MPRHFSVEEANQLLPRLRELLTKAQPLKQELDHVRGELRRLLERAQGNGHAAEAAVAAVNQRGEELAGELRSLVQETAALGCQLRDLDLGLVDFPALRAGREILLCWRLGEERVAFWHDLEAGYAGRKPL